MSKTALEVLTTILQDQGVTKKPETVVEALGMLGDQVGPEGMAAHISDWIDAHPDAVGVVSDDAVTSAKILDGSVATADLADSSVTSGKIADGGVATADLADAAVTTEKLNDLAVTEGKIANNAVTSGKIADGAVGTSDLASSSVTAPKLATDSVLTAKIADQNVTDEKLAPNGVLAKADRLLGNVPSRTMEAAIVHTTDAHAAQPLELTIHGRSTQVKTTGKNLADTSYYTNDVRVSGLTVTNIVTDSRSDFRIMLAFYGESEFISNVAVQTVTSAASVTHTFTAPEGAVSAVFKHNGSTKDVRIARVALTGGNTYTLSLNVTGYNSGSTGGLVINSLQIEAGLLATPYEPYTGGMPSPSPSKPQAIDSVDDVVATFGGGYYVSPSMLEQGLIDGNTGDGTSSTRVRTKNAERIPVKEGQTLTLHVESSAGTPSAVINCYSGSGNARMANSGWIGDGASYTIPSGATNIRIMLRVTSDAQVTPSDFEVFDLYSDKRLIDLNGLNLRMLPDGTRDTLSVDGSGNVTVTRNVGAITYDGSESWALGNGSKRVETSAPANSRSLDANDSTTLLCDNFETRSANQTWNGTRGVSKIGGVHFADGTGSMTVAGWKAWLSKHPTTLLYPLATATTESLGQISLRELRSLPDGTCDELTIDADGNVVLTQRVGKVVLDGNAQIWSASSGILRAIITDSAFVPNIDTPQYFYTSRFVAATHRECVNNNTVGTTAFWANVTDTSGRRVNLNTGDTSVVDIPSAMAWLTANPTTVIYPLATPKVIDLGRLTLPPMPKLTSPESYVWASTTPSTKVRLTYERDTDMLHPSRDAMNLLRGTATGAVAQAHGTYTAPPLGLTVDGKSVQDGTPTPSSPVAIDSVESVSAVLAGKNLLYNQTNLHLNDSSGGVLAYFATATSYVARVERNTNYTFSCVGGNRQVAVGTGATRPAENVSYSSISVTAIGTTAFTFNSGSNDFVLIKAGVSATVTNPQLERGTSVTYYEAPTAPVTIPLDGHELRSLPDGTHDELQVDADGNVTLVQRVAALEVDGTKGTWQVGGDYSSTGGGYYYAGNFGTAYGVSIGSGEGHGFCDMAAWSVLPVASDNHSTISWTGVNNVDELRVRLYEESSAMNTTTFKAWLATNKPKFYFALKTPVTHDLGTVTLPALAAPDATVWATTTPSTTVTLDYERDLTAAITAIESAIADMA